MYPDQIVSPMREELTKTGFTETRTAAEVEQLLTNEKGTILFVINSVCGCAAGNARPGVKLALEHSDKKPTVLATAFAGNDTEAVGMIRQYMLPYPPCSPAMALFKEGKLVHIIERHNIEGKNAQMVAQNLVEAFDKYC